VFSGGVDGTGRMFDITTGQPRQVAQHDAPIKAVKWINSPHGGILATGSWDKTIKVSGISATYRLLHAQTIVVLGHALVHSGRSG
jgi:WD40 repeat protein